jgi:hypothetical protein
MSRHGYSDSLDDLELGRWRGVVASAARGRRGQRFFRDLIEALDALPEKRLVRNELETQDGAVCALGALGKARGVDLSTLDTTDWGELGATFDIAHQLAQEVMFNNDEPGYNTPEERWLAIREWAVRSLRDPEERAAKALK